MKRDRYLMKMQATLQEKEEWSF